MDEYYLDKTITTPLSSGTYAISQIWRPIISEEERAKRMKAIHDAAVRLAIANRRAEEKKRLEAAAGSR